MNILHLESSSRNCSVAISSGTELVCLCEEVSENYKQSESLHTFVEWALEGADLQLSDIDAVAVGKGPGSYTGLRIGAASAKGFCYGLGIPLITINSLETMIVPFLGMAYDFIIPVIDARRNEVYCAIYDGVNGKIMRETEAKILDEHSFREYRDHRIVFIGDGAKKSREILQLPLADFNEEIFPTAKYLIPKAVEKYKKKEFENVAYFEPFYLKDFQGVKQKKSEN